MESEQSDVLNYFLGCGKEERGRFMRRYLDNLPNDELHGILGLVNSAKKRRKRIQEQHGRRSTADLLVSDPVATTTAVRSPEGATRSVVVDPEAVPQPVARGWWTKYDSTQVFSVDVEKVEVPNPLGRNPKYFQVAATVAVVDGNRKTVYSTKIKHAAGSFRINPHNKTGFKSHSLINGKPLTEVTEDLLRLFSGNLVIGVALGDDLDSLGLSGHSTFETFDLQWFWYRMDEDVNGVLMKKVLGLRSMCKYYFNIDMQPEHIYHDAAVDAEWTMDLFLDIYSKCPTNTKWATDPSNHIVHFKNLYK